MFGKQNGSVVVDIEVRRVRNRLKVTLSLVKAAMLIVVCLSENLMKLHDHKILLLSLHDTRWSTFMTICSISGEIKSVRRRRKTSGGYAKANICHQTFSCRMKPLPITNVSTNSPLLQLHNPPDRTHVSYVRFYRTTGNFNLNCLLWLNFLFSA